MREPVACGVCGRPAFSAAAEGPHAPCAQHARLPPRLYAAMAAPLVRARLASLDGDLVDDAVDVWHELGEPSARAANDNVTMELHEFLGWSEGEYQAWVLDPGLLPGSPDSRDSVAHERRLREARDGFRLMAARMAVWSHPSKDRLLALAGIADPERRNQALLFLVGAEQADILGPALDALAELDGTDAPEPA